MYALSGVSLDVQRGQFVAVVGPNGAGKTTLFKTISGVVTPVAGQIRYNGQDLLAVPPAERAQLGIAHVPEGRQVFASMTVMENLEMGAYTRKGQKRWSETLPTILELFPILSERRDQLAGTLSGGEQQMLAIGRGLASAPDLLMLDEPSMGLAPTIVDAIFERIHLIHRNTTSPSCSSNSALPRLWRPAIAATCWKPDAWCWRVRTIRMMSDARVRRAYLGM